MHVIERPDLSEALKKAAGRPDPARYQTSVTDLLFCCGKASGKEWDYSFPFNARLIRGLDAESAIRRYFSAINIPIEIPEARTLDGIEGHADALTPEHVVEVKSTDIKTTKLDLPEHQTMQQLAYCKIYARTKGYFITLFNRLNDGFGEIVIREVAYTPDDIDNNWKKLLKRKVMLDEARAWARKAGPREIHYRYRRPNYPWECGTDERPMCQFKRAGLCPGVKK